MRKIFLFFIFLLGVLPAFSKVKIGDLYYNLNDTERTAEVTYEKQYTDSYGSASITIPKTVNYYGIIYTVTAIGEDAFGGCMRLTSVEIPNSVMSIGGGAFWYCESLTNIEIPNSVTSIGVGAFMYCSGLTSIDIPSSVISLENAFYDCYNLEAINVSPDNINYSSRDGILFNKDYTVLLICPAGKKGAYEIPNSVTSIGISAFDSCTGLTSIEIPNSVTSIGRYAFNFCDGLTSVEISDISSWCKISFENSSANPLSYAENLYLKGNLVTSLVIPNSITSLGDNVFYNCRCLTSVEIPNSVTSLGDNVFYNCSGLTSVEIPNSVNSIGDNVFYNCSGLTSVEIPNSVNSIGERAFSYCNSLTSVEIPNSVTSIGNETFRNCTGLTRVEIPNSVTSIRNEAFSFCTNLTSVEIPNSVTSIGNEAFRNCTGLTSIEIPNSVTSIGEGAFYECIGLTSVEIGNSVTSLEDSVFQYCSSLTSVDIPNSVTSIGEWAFYGCGGLTSVEIPNSVTSIGEGAFNGCPIESLSIDCEKIENWFSSFKTIKKLTIGDSVISIDDDSFKDCDLNEIILEDNTPPSYFSPFSRFTDSATLFLPEDADLSEYLISDWAKFLNINQSYIYTKDDGVFNYRFVENISEAYLLPSSKYTNMTSASIPDRVVGTKNGEESFFQVAGVSPDAFKSCRNLTNVKLPAHCKGIGSSAFEGCTGLTKVEIPNSVSLIGQDAFKDCRNLTGVNISDLEAWCKIDFGNAMANPIYYAKNLSLNNDTISSLSIPESISQIKDYSFYNCLSLEGDLRIPLTINSIGTAAFANIKFENCIIEDCLEALSWNSDNNINAKNLYVGRNTEGSIRYSGIENLEVGAFVETIPADRFNNATLTSLIINPGSSIVIADGAFKGCANLSVITLPEDIAEIGANAFSSTALKNITVPNGIIGANAFADCNLDNIIIGAGVESIGEKAFDGSNALKNVYATPNTPPMAENNTFSYYEAQLYVPEDAIDTYYNFTRCWYRFNGKPLVMPENIVIDGPTDIKGEEGETMQLTATIQPGNVTLDRVLWRSTNTAVATVDNNGLVTIHNFSDNEDGNNRYCEIIASTLYEDSPVAVVRIQPSTSSIEYLNSENFNSGLQNISGSGDIYNLQGVCIKRNASQEDINALTPGIYIINGKKVMVK